jgi:NAD(P)-dependent dehydrogenase (short-subunit alcohol dehydrogenase family)
VPIEDVPESGGSQRKPKAELVALRGSRRKPKEADQSFFGHSAGSSSRSQLGPSVVKDNVEKLIPMGRFGTPGEVVGAVLFLSSAAASYCTGSDIVVDGGYTCV